MVKPEGQADAGEPNRRGTEDHYAEEGDPDICEVEPVRERGLQHLVDQVTEITLLRRVRVRLSIVHKGPYLTQDAAGNRTEVDSSGRRR